MYTIIIFAAVLAVAASATLPYSDVYVVRENPLNSDNTDGYQYGYELSDGTRREESARVESRGRAIGAEDDGALRVRGSYSFVADDGQTYAVNYVADETGFHPEGAHLPALPNRHY